MCVCVCFFFPVDIRMRFGAFHLLSNAAGCRHQDTVRVHFRSVLFYHFYHQEGSECKLETGL